MMTRRNVTRVTLEEIARTGADINIWCTNCKTGIQIPAENVGQLGRPEARLVAAERRLRCKRCGVQAAEISISPRSVR